MPIWVSASVCLLLSLPITVNKSLGTLQFYLMRKLWRNTCSRAKDCTQQCMVTHFECVTTLHRGLRSPSFVSNLLRLVSYSILLWICKHSAAYDLGSRTDEFWPTSPEVLILKLRKLSMSPYWNTDPTWDLLPGWNDEWIALINSHQLNSLLWSSSDRINWGYALTISFMAENGNVHHLA